MRCISFAATTPQFLDGTKDVTRRLGWWHLLRGDRLLAVDKYRGVPRDQRVELGIIEIVGRRREQLCDIEPADVVREGFPHMTGAEFVAFFCRLNGCTPETFVNRIEFRRVPS